MLHRRKVLTNGGFTLVEVLVATTLLAMVVLAVANMLITGRLAAGTSKQQITAVNLAQAVLEERLAGSDPGPSVAASPLDGKSGYQAYKNYFYQVEVDPEPVIQGKRDADFYGLTVHVYYQDPGSSQARGKVTLYTLKRKG